MAESKKERLTSCPLCFLKQNDASFLRYDPKKDEYYCTRCCYAAKFSKVQADYDWIKTTYKKVLRRDNSILMQLDK